MKTITFKCKNKDYEILGIVICIMLFLAGWIVSSAIARHFGNYLLITVGIPVLFLTCGVVYMNRNNAAQRGEGSAKFADSGDVKLTFGGRSVIFTCQDVKNVYYMRDTLTNDGTGNGYVLVIRLPHRVYRVFSEELPQGVTGFENTELYAVYLELKDRLVLNGKAE